MKEIIISLGCAAISGIVAWIVAKQAAKAEIEKLQAIWAHEKETAYDTEFDEMVAAVSLLVKHPAIANFTTAISKVGAYRSKAPGELAEVIDKLNDLLDRGNLNYSEIEETLNAAIECKRKGNS